MQSSYIRIPLAALDELYILKLKSFLLSCGVSVLNIMNLQPDRVADFCTKNKLQLIIRAHECVMDGFERFAQGQLITVFSATNYCGNLRTCSIFLVNIQEIVHYYDQILFCLNQGQQTMPEQYLWLVGVWLLFQN